MWSGCPSQWPAGPQSAFRCTSTTLRRSRQGMNSRRILSGFVGALVALALVGVTQAEAQSAAQFVGKWTITFAPPAGAPGGGAGGPPPGAGPGGGGPGGGGGGRGGPTVVEITQTGGV